MLLYFGLGLLFVRFLSDQLELYAVSGWVKIGRGRRGEIGPLSLVGQLSGERGSLLGEHLWELGVSFP